MIFTKELSNIILGTYGRLSKVYSQERILKRISNNDMPKSLETSSTQIILMGRM